MSARRSEGLAIEDVADDRFSAGGGQPVGLLGRPRHRADGVAGSEEQWYEATTDDTGSTCEVDAHVATLTADWTRYVVHSRARFVGHFAAPRDCAFGDDLRDTLVTSRWRR
jgi:hypothetical protein